MCLADEGSGTQTPFSAPMLVKLQSSSPDDQINFSASMFTLRGGPRRQAQDIATLAGEMITNGPDRFQYISCITQPTTYKQTFA